MSSRPLQAGAASSPHDTHRFDVPDMSCGHCVKAITEGIKSLFPAADVVIDLDAHRVSVTSDASTEALRSAIQDAGYAAQVAQ